MDEVGNGNRFCDYEAFNGIESNYSAIALTNVDILSITDMDLKAVLNKKVYEEMKSEVKVYSDASKVRKQYFFNNLWVGYKDMVMEHLNNDRIN